MVRGPCASQLCAAGLATEKGGVKCGHAGWVGARPMACVRTTRRLACAPCATCDARRRPRAAIWPLAPKGGMLIKTPPERGSARTCGPPHRVIVPEANTLPALPPTPPATLRGKSRAETRVDNAIRGMSYLRFAGRICLKSTRCHSDSHMQVTSSRLTSPRQGRRDIPIGSLAPSQNPQIISPQVVDGAGLREAAEEGCSRPAGESVAMPFTHALFACAHLFTSGLNA